MIGDNIYPYREILLTDADMDRWAHRLWHAKAVVLLVQDRLSEVMVGSQKPSGALSYSSFSDELEQLTSITRL